MLVCFVFHGGVGPRSSPLLPQSLIYIISPPLYHPNLNLPPFEIHTHAHTLSTTTTTTQQQ